MFDFNVLKTKIGRTALLLGALFVAAGCQPDDAPEAAPVKVYRHAIDGAPSSLDPAHAANVYAATVVKNVFDTLYRYKYLARPYELTPSLAAAMPRVSDDGLIYTIRLRADARFADAPAFEGGRGRTVTAEDVIYSLKRHFVAETRSRGAWLWRDHIAGLPEDGVLDDVDEPVSGLRAIDARTVRIELESPYPQFTHTLAMALSGIVPREVVERRGRTFGVRPIGSGPFELERFDETLAVLVPNPNFDRGKVDLEAEGYDPARHTGYDLEAIDGQAYPMLDRLEVHFVTEPTARWTGFVSSDGLDTVMVPPELAERVLADRQPPTFRGDIEAKYYSRAGLEAGFVFHGFNMVNPEIGHHDDPERDRRNRQLRCALRDAFDWDARNEAFYHGLGRLFPGAIPPLLGAYDPDADTESLEHRPALAGERLRAAGWQQDALPDLVYGLESSVQQRQMFEQFRAWLDGIGYPARSLTPRSFGSFGEYARAIGQRELDIFLLGWTLAYPDAQYALQLFYGPNAAPGANSMNYDNPEFDRLFERATRMPAGPERDALYRRLNDMVIQDCVIIGSLSRTRLHLWKRHVRMLPDREMIGGHFLRFVDVVTPTP